MASIVFGIAFGAVYGLVAVGIVLVYKASRVLNFAQAEFGTFALYLTWWLGTTGVPWVLAALVAVAVASAAGIGFERLVVRPMGDASRVSLSVASAGLLLLLFAIELKVWGASPRVLGAPLRGQGLPILGTALNPMQLLSLAVLAALAVGLGILFTRTRFGLGLLAVAEDASTARLMGVPYARVSAFTWGVAGALGGLAGILIGPQLGGFAPLSLTYQLLLPGMAAALLGGLTSLPGAFVGGMLVGVVESLLRGGFDVVGVASYGLFVLILAVLLFRPRGLFGRAA